MKLKRVFERLTGSRYLFHCDAKRPIFGEPNALSRRNMQHSIFDTFLRCLPRGPRPTLRVNECYDRDGSSFRLKWFLSGVGSLSQNRRKNAIFLHDSRRGPQKPWDFFHPAEVFGFLQISFWESQIEETSAKKVVHLSRSTRQSLRA